MITKLYLLMTILKMVVSRELSEENTTNVQDKNVNADFWSTLADYALSEDSFKSLMENLLKWVIFLVTRTMIKLYF